MDKYADIQKSSQPPAEPSHASIPVGYRQGIITAITVLLGFALLFVRYWGFELPGAWNVSAIIAAVLMAVAIVLLIVALWRSLQIEDNEEPEYRKTLRWFLAATIVLMTGLLLSGLSFTHIVKF